MTGRQFYDFCRDQRKVEPDGLKQYVLGELYRFMINCGYSYDSIERYITRRIFEETEKNDALVKAYEWLLKELPKKIVPATAPEQGTLF